MSTEIETEMLRLRATPMSNRRVPTSALLTLAEDSLGVEFPTIYREFLEQYSYYSVVADCPCQTMNGTYIEYFYGFRLDRDESECFLELDELGTAPHAISIGCDLFGGQFLMFLTSTAHGRIYFCDVEGSGGDFLDDPEWESNGLSFDDLPDFDKTEDKPVAFQNLHFVAPDFISFLRMLNPSDRDRPT